MCFNNSGLMTQADLAEKFGLDRATMAKLISENGIKPIIQSVRLPEYSVFAKYSIEVVGAVVAQYMANKQNKIMIEGSVDELVSKALEDEDIEQEIHEMRAFYLEATMKLLKVKHDKQMAEIKDFKQLIQDIERIVTNQTIGLYDVLTKVDDKFQATTEERAAQVSGEARVGRSEASAALTKLGE